MKILMFSFILFTLTACSEKAFEELAFRKALEYSLVDKCGSDKKCVNVVETKTKSCMIKSDWRKTLADKDNEVEKKRFAKKFYACLVDEQGKPYFQVK